MNEIEYKMLAELLVKYHNSIGPQNASFYGERMDKALCRDLFSTLYRNGDYKMLGEIQEGFALPPKS